MRIWNCVRAVTAFALAASNGACGLSQAHSEATGLVDRYFIAAAGPDTAALMSFYSPKFFEVTPRDAWAGTLNELRYRCGTPTTHTLTSWTVNSRAGTNSGSTAKLVYDVGYERCHMSETISTFRPDGGEPKIIGHVFKLESVVPERAAKTAVIA